MHKIFISTLLCNFLKSWICCVRRMLLLANKNRQQITHSTESESRWINLNSYFCYKNYSRPFWNKAKKATQSHKIISIAMYVIMYMCHLARFTYSKWHFWQKGLLLAGLEFNLLILKSNYKKYRLKSLIEFYSHINITLVWHISSWAHLRSRGHDLNLLKSLVVLGLLHCRSQRFIISTSELMWNYAVSKWTKILSKFRTIC